MSIQDALKGIRRRYADHLHDHRAQLFNLVQDARQGSDPVAAIEQIRFRAHKISGTAATLGFQSLGETAALCEQRANVCLEAQAHVDPMLAVATQLIDRIDEALGDIG